MLINIIKSSLILVVCSPFISFGMESEPSKTITVYHLGQLHGSIDDLMEPLLDAMKQHKIGPNLNGTDFIKKFRDIYVSQKGIYQWLTDKLIASPEAVVYHEHVSEMPTEATVLELQSIFSDFSIDSPSYEQMLSIAYHRPARVLFALGLLKNLRTGENLELFEKACMLGLLSEEGQKCAFGEREEWLVNTIKAAIEAGLNHDIVIVFGSAHDFEKYFTPGPDQLVSDVKFVRLDFARKDVPYEPLIDFNFAHTGFINDITFDQLVRIDLQVELINIYHHLAGAYAKLSTISLSDPASISKSTFEMMRSVELLPSKESLITTGDAYFKSKVISALSQSSNLDEFMENITLIYHSKYYWDRTSQSILHRTHSRPSCALAVLETMEEVMKYCMETENSHVGAILLPKLNHAFGKFDNLNVPEIEILRDLVSTYLAFLEL